MLLKVDCLPNAVGKQPSIPLIYLGRKWTLNWWWWWWWSVIIVWVGATMSHFAKCNTNLKVRAMSRICLPKQMCFQLFCKSIQMGGPKMLLKVDCLPNAVGKQLSKPLIDLWRKWTLSWWWWWWWWWWSKPEEEDLKSTGGTFLLLGPAKAKDFMPQSDSIVNATAAPAGSHEKIMMLEWP